MKKSYNHLILPVILSIVASMIYSRFIDPNLDNTFLYLGNLFASLSGSYLNYVYGNIGDGVKEIFSYYTYAFVFGMIISFIFLSFLIVLRITIKVFINKEKEEKEEIETLPTKESEKRKKSPFEKKFTSTIMCILSLCIFLSILSITIKHHYTYNAIIYIEKTLDILAPKLDEQTRLELRAQYRQINNYESFNSFNQKIKQLAKEKAISIPQFELIVK